MKTVINNTNKIIINKSKFITYLYQINDIKEVNNKLSNIKEIHKGATHYCYAYIIDNNIRANDDGEPSGTAGVPILNVLQKEELNHVLCIVVRYFGGIKLGAGGLVRAYTKSVTSSLKITNLKKYIKIEITFPLDKIKEIDNLLKNIKIKKLFTNNVNYTFDIEFNNYEIIKDKLKSITELKEKNIIYK